MTITEHPYDFGTIEKKWQAFWETNKTFRAVEKPGTPKYYILDMFPYPSGAGLHVGHPEGYTATDILARYKRMKGFNVLHPIGWDAFGLPAERYAVRTGTHPRVTTQTNIANFRRQIKSLGFSYDWDREVDTTDPKYCRWTQWIFLQLYKKGLAYLHYATVNFCPQCRTVLANEEVKQGVCDQGHTVIRKPMRQWMLKITEYAERLLNDLEDLDWPDSIKKLQRDWIGKSEGAEVDFILCEDDQRRAFGKATSFDAFVAARKGQAFPEAIDPAVIRIYTTRPDTLFGATYMVLSPEHPLIGKITSDAQKAAVTKYCDDAARKSDLERTDLAKTKTGVFTGAHAINPVTGQPIPIWVADYVLISYGTGAIMAVPGHDERDYEFAKTFDLPIVEVVSGGDIREQAYTGDGKLVNSSSTRSTSIDGLAVPDAKKKITGWLADHALGRAATNYKLRDWLFSRQRYWGEPFPVLFDDADNVHLVDESELPIELPQTDQFKPAETGESPLANAKEWVNVSVGGKAFRRDTNTMPQWAGSCWYYLRYLDPNNEGRAWDAAKEKYWMPVDLYVGGAEHAVLHLLYSRFWHKVLFDLGYVSTKEPFQKLFNQGMILSFTYKDERGACIPHHDIQFGDDGKPRAKATGEVLTESIEKMSKTLGNVINPDDVIGEFGADTLRLYEMAMGPLEATKPWNTRDVAGVHRFLHRVWRMVIDDQTGKIHPSIRDVAPDDEQLKILHRTIKKVSLDVESMRFNTAISAMMIFVNTMLSKPEKSRSAIEPFVLALSPFAPHLAEELWQRLGHSDTLAYHAWPTWDERYTVDNEIEIPIQICGKVRSRITVAADCDVATIEKLALADAAVQKALEGKTVRKVIVPNGKLVNIVAS